MTVEAETSQPARSDSPDLIDGGHGWLWIYPQGRFSASQNARITGLSEL